MVWYRWYSNTTTPRQTTVTENTTTTGSYISSRSRNMNQLVDATTTTNTTNHSNINKITNDIHNKKYRYINYHLLSQSKIRQQHLLRCYVRTNNLKRIQDYYQSIQNYYYHTQQVLERTQQQRIQCPSRRQRKKRNRNRNSDTPDEDDDGDSIYIRIDFGGGGGNSIENDDDDDSSCLPDEANHDPDTVFVSPLNHNRNRDDVAEADSIVDDPPLPPPLSEPRNSTNSNNVNRMTTTMLPLNHLVDTNEYDFFAGASNAVASPNNNNNNTGTAVIMMSPVYTMLDIDASINPNETLNWTILYYACFHHQYDIVKYLIEECYASLKCTDRYHNTILHWICHYPLPTPTPPTVTLVDQDMASGNNSHSNKTKTTTRKMQRFMNYYHHRSQPPGHVNNDPNMKNIVLLLQYIMECAPKLLLVCNNYKELPIHWLCQYGNNNLCLIQCMIQFIQTNPYFAKNQNTVTTTNNNNNNHRSDRDPEETTTTTTTRGSSSIRRLLYQEDQYHRTPMDVARLYHNDDIAQYLQSLLL